MEAFDHAWSLLKAAGRMSPVGGSAETQPVGRYLDRTKGGPPMEQWGSPAEGEKRAGINPREMVEEAEPPEPASQQQTLEHPIDQAGLDRRTWGDWNTDDPFNRFGEMAGHDALRDINKPSMRHKEEMMRELEQQTGGPPVSSGYDQMPIEQKVEHARGYVPKSQFSGEYSGGTDYHTATTPDSSVYSGWKGFDPKMAPLSQEIYQQR